MTRSCFSFGPRSNETFSGNPFTATSFASTAVEVQLDSFTYTATIKGIWITIDCGEIFDEVAAKRAIMLHIQQELTTLVKGATINCNKFSINFIQSNNKTGQIGELVHNTLPAAFAAALSMALQTQLSVLPCTEEQIYNLIQAREIEKEKELGSEEAAENENKKEFGE